MFFKRYFLLIIAINHFYHKFKQSVLWSIVRIWTILRTIQRKIKQKYGVILKQFLEDGMKNFVFQNGVLQRDHLPERCVLEREYCTVHMKFTCWYNVSKHAWIKLISACERLFFQKVPTHAERKRSLFLRYTRI